MIIYKVKSEDKINQKNQILVHSQEYKALYLNIFEGDARLWLAFIYVLKSDFIKIFANIRKNQRANNLR